MATHFAEMQQKGQDLYRKKDYKSALTIFNNLLSGCHSPPIDLLDNRAATHTKLNNLPIALKDGKKMISLDKKNPAGYLRTGQVLRLMGKDKTALEIYTYGLKYVDRVSDGGKLLIGMRDKLVNQKETPGSCDPLESLPVEIVEMILEYFTFKTFQRLRSVSKRWSAFLSETPRLWRNIDFSSANKRVRLTTFKQSILRGRGQTTHMALKNIVSGDFDIYKYAVARCPRLESLRVFDTIANVSLVNALAAAPKLRILSIESENNSIDKVTQILQRCPHLVTAKFYSVRTPRFTPKWEGDLSGLKSLTIALSKDETWANILDLNLPELQLKTPNLENLELVDIYWGDWMNLGHAFEGWQSLLSITISNIPQYPLMSQSLSNLPRTLESLTLRGCFYGVADTPHQLDGHFQSLKMLDVHGVVLDSRAPGPVSKLLASSGSHMEEIKLTIAHSSSGNFASHLGRVIEAGKFQKVRSMTLGAEAANDSVVAIIAATCPLLQDINLRDSQEVTGVGLKALILKSGSKIREITLHNCRAIGADAIEFARNQGIRVWKSQSGTHNSGHKVRYG